MYIHIVNGRRPSDVLDHKVEETKGDIPSKHGCPTKPIKTKSLSNKSSPKMVPRSAAAICHSMRSRIVSKLELGNQVKKGLSKPAVPTTKQGGHAFNG